MRNQTSSVFTEEFLTVKEVADFLRVTPGWVYQRIHSKTLPFAHIKVGHYPRFPKRAVENFVSSQLRTGEGAA